MKFYATWLLFGLFIMANPALPQADSAAAEIAQLKAQLKALTQQVNALENRLKTAENSAPKESKTTTEQQASITQNNVTEQPRIRFSGDFRGRYDYADKRQQTVRKRSRIRMRLAAIADINDDVSLHFRLATGGDNPTSTNQTLDGSFSSKDIRLDRAYVNYKLTDNSLLSGGKMKNPFQRIGGSGVLFDGDLNPEGLAHNYDTGSWQTAIGAFYLDERKNEDEVMLYGAQLSHLWNLSNSQFQLGLGYYDYHNLQGSEPLYNGQTLGNSFDANNKLINDFNIIEAFSGWQSQWRDRPLELFATYLRNTAAAEADIAYLTGINYGTSKKVNQWQVGYQYWHVEADAVYALFNDSDFADGFTNARGHLWGLSYGLRNNLSVGVSYIDSLMFMDSANPIQYDRILIDFNYWFK